MIRNIDIILAMTQQDVVKRMFCERELVVNNRFAGLDFSIIKSDLKMLREKQRIVIILYDKLCRRRIQFHS